ncbi:MAG: heavy metal-binding domain-containing protein [Acidimicrobiales bacterium]
MTVAGPPGGQPEEFRPSDRRPVTPTSDLSVAEAAALRRVGLSPVGFVMGTAVMQLVSGFTGSMMGGPLAMAGGGWGGLLSPVRSRGEYAEAFPCAHGYAWGTGAAEHYGFNAENTVLAGSLFEGYGLAFSRLQQEAVALGAHGVVGVDPVFEYLVGGAGTATFLVTGTAVVHAGSAPLETPFLTNASGQSFERLVGLGYVPAGIAVGVGVVYVKPNCVASGNLTAVGANRQIPAAIGVARGRARQWLAGTGHKMGEGVVHTDWTDSRIVRYGESWNQLALGIGTAVRRFRSEAEPLVPRPVVSLRP